MCLVKRYWQSELCERLNCCSIFGVTAMYACLTPGLFGAIESSAGDQTLLCCVDSRVQITCLYDMDIPRPDNFNETYLYEGLIMAKGVVT